MLDLTDTYSRKYNLFRVRPGKYKPRLTVDANTKLLICDETIFEVCVKPSLTVLFVLPGVKQDTRFIHKTVIPLRNRFCDTGDYQKQKIIP